MTAKTVRARYTLEFKMAIARLKTELARVTLERDILGKGAVEQQGRQWRACPPSAYFATARS